MLVNRPEVDAEDPPALSLQWEETPCLLCGRDDREIRSEATDPTPAAGPGLCFAIVQCRHCGLIYTNPRPTEATIGRFYPADYRPHAPRGKRADPSPLAVLEPALRAAMPGTARPATVHRQRPAARLRVRWGKLSPAYVAARLARDGA